MKEVMSLLGLSKRAGKLVPGEAQVLEAVRNNKAKLIFVALDAGVNTSKRIHDKAKYYNVPLVDIFSKDELSIATGDCNRIVCAVIDKGFSKKMLELIEKGQ